MVNDINLGEKLAALLEPFDEKTELEWVITNCGGNAREGFYATCAPYVDNRAIQRRLDAVFGPFNWRNEFAPGPDAVHGGVICGISIRNPERPDEWITKWDGAVASKTEPMKGGLSNAMKRCAVQWGIGRYLYDNPEPYKASCVAKRDTVHNKKWNTKAKENFYWAPPALNLDLRKQQAEAAARREAAESRAASRRRHLPDKAPEPAQAATTNAPATTTPPAPERPAMSPEAVKALEFVRTVSAEKFDATAARLAQAAEKFTREESLAIKSALAQRAQELAQAAPPPAPEEPPAAAEPEPTGDTPLQAKVRAKLVELNCPPDQIDDWIEASGFKDNPVEFVARKPWLPRNPVATQQPMF